MYDIWRMLANLGYTISQIRAFDILSCIFNIYNIDFADLKKTILLPVDKCWCGTFNLGVNIKSQSKFAVLGSGVVFKG